jgi:hypothetical protein
MTQSYSSFQGASYDVDRKRRFCPIDLPLLRARFPGALSGVS